ncbi:hypothetical protein BH23CHL8_BH23CHL8_19150 [soil metagenome]
MERSTNPEDEESSADTRPGETDSAWSQPEQAVQEERSSENETGSLYGERPAEPFSRHPGDDHANWSSGGSYQEPGSGEGYTDEPAVEQPAWPEPAVEQSQPAWPEPAAQQSQPAWSEPAVEQSQPAWPEPAAQQSNAYSAPEPQAYTYQQPEQPVPGQQGPNDQQAYPQQPQYDPQAYAQQQQQYAQQQYAQQQYDPQAYAQQQQQYAQQQYDPQAYAQQQQQYAQQGYPPQGYEQQGQAYGQQPGYPPQGGYYDPSWQQGYGYPPGYAQQPAPGYPPQPYAYGATPPGAWPMEADPWQAQPTGYARSAMAIISGFILFAWGLFYLVYGALALWLGSLSEFLAEAGLNAQLRSTLDEMFTNPVAGGILVALGVLHILGAFGIWIHRGWGRAIGIFMGLLGTVAGVGLVISSIDLTIGDITIAGQLGDSETAFAFAVFVLITYLFVLLGMIIGRRHFRRRGVVS